MATILEGLNAISQAVGGTGGAESNLEALNQISGALGGSADATENAEAIANIAENASGGGGGGSDLSTASLTIKNGLRLPTKNIVTTWIGTGEGLNPAGVYTGQTEIPSGGITTFDVPLYKGLFVMDFDTSANYEVTGDAKVENGMLYVTGNATVAYTS